MGGENRRSKMADEGPWELIEDGYLNIDTDSKTIIYHPNLNIILVSTKSSEVHVVDVNSGVILQKSSLSGMSHVDRKTILQVMDYCSSNFM
jgi:hypothetical protein